jgi:hypothetical protein
MSQHDDLTDTLTRELSERARTMDGSLLHLADVQGRARSIRRRRTATAVAGVAAAVAILVPTVALATHTSGKPEPAPPITQTPSPTQTATDDRHQPAPGVLDVSDLPTGDAPRMEYVTDGTVLHQFDGSTVDIHTRYPVTSFAVLTDGTHVWQTADDQGNSYVEVQDSEGTYHEPVPSEGGLTVSDSHDAAGWLRPDHQVMVWTTGAAQARPLGEPIPAGRSLRIGPFEAEDCVPDYCSLLVNVSGGNPPWQPWEVADYATRPFTDGQMLTVADVSGGVFMGLTKIDEFGSCSVLWGGGEFVGFDTCKHTLVSSSPAEPLVLADPAYHDGIGNGVIAMYAVHGGKLLWERRSTEKAQAFYPAAQWEDGTHVLAPVFQDGEWSIVRFASDGSMEYGVAPVAGEDVDNPYVLETGGPAVGD